MNAVSKIEAAPLSGLALLRAPFPPNLISKLPKETRAQIDARKADKNLMVWKCPECGGPHHKNAVHLDYVGHAALTDRLLDADPAWSWEPLATADGLPALDRNGGLWIKLTVCNVTRLGYGAADGKAGGDAIKEIIGDALRNAAMRFGAALDLWHKGDLHVDDKVADEPPAKSTPAPRAKPDALTGPYKTRAEARTGYGTIVRDLTACSDEEMLSAVLDTYKDEIKQFERELPDAWNGDGADFIGLRAEIERRTKLIEMENA